MRNPNLSPYFPVRFAQSLFLLISFCFASPLQAQVKIGNNPNTIDPNAALEIESTNKGFLPPRVIINSLSSVSPLSGTVPAGMLVYSSGGSVSDGYYYWTGTEWRSVQTANLNTVQKSADASLAKTETFVLASNSITLTLPAITSADNGLSITIKNNGSHTHLVKVKTPATSVKIDGQDSITLTRWIGKTFIAFDGNWITKEKESTSHNVFEVSHTGSWTSIKEVIEFLNLHMEGPSVVKLTGDDFQVTSTQIINLPFPLTVQGASYGKTSISAAASLSGPLFRAQTECYFKMLSFDGTVGSYKNTTGNDAIQYEGSGEYFEVKDCSFDGFNKALVAETNVELWVFEVDVINAEATGIEVAASTTTHATLKVSEVDFISCAKGIHLLSGDSASISIINSTFYNGTGGYGIDYTPATFTSFVTMFITNNAWNNEGTFFNGFDFTRSDARDANAFIQNNAGEGDRHPTCRINVQNNNIATTVTTANVLAKAAWTNTSFNTTKWTIDNNKITYQPSNKRSAVLYITGNISVDSPNETVSICIIKKGGTSTRIGETELRLATSGQPYQFSTVIYLETVDKDDFFELYCTTTTSGKLVTFRDVQWFTDTK